MNWAKGFLRRGLKTIALLLLLGGLSATSAAAQTQKPATGPTERSASDTRPYDKELLQLAEVLGAVHYLRELCGAHEGQLWRNQMRALIQAEGTTARRRAALVSSFNKGYRGYGRTYRTCTRLALLAIDRFMREGVTLAKNILRAGG